MHKQQSHQLLPLSSANPITAMQPQSQMITNATTIQQIAAAHKQGTIMTSNGNCNGSNNIPVAFVEFRDVQSAGQAMQLLQGKYLLSSDRGAIRIEYAKSKMASNEQMIATYTAAASAVNGRSHY
jgi:hypothetical protein